MKLADYMKVIESNQARIGAQVHRFADHEICRAEAGVAPPPEAATLLDEALGGQYRQMCRDLQAVDHVHSAPIEEPRAESAVAVESPGGEDR